MKQALVPVLLFIVVFFADAFQPALLHSSAIRRTVKHGPQTQMLAATATSDDHDKADVSSPRRSRMSRFILSKLKPFGLGIVTLATSFCVSSFVPPPIAHAATPLPKSATMPDAEKTAMRGIQLEMEKKQQLETEDYNRRARHIEASEGAKAREVFEKEYREAKEQRDQELMEDLEELQRGLLDQGIDPFNDMEGYRQCFLLKTGKNLAEVEGTDQYADAQIAMMGLTKQTYSFQKATNRQIIKMMVQDYKNRGIDPLPEFVDKDNHQKHAKILFLTKSAASKRLASMQDNMVMHGQIDPPKPGEVSLKEMLETDPDLAIRNEQAIQRAIHKFSDDTAAKDAEKVKAQPEKAKIKAEAQRAKDEARAAKELAKNEARMAKEAAKETKRLAKEQKKQEVEAAKAAATAAAMAAAGVAAAATVSHAIGEVAIANLEGAMEIVQQAGDGGVEVASNERLSLGDFEDDSKFATETGPVISQSLNTQKSKGLPMAKVGGLIAVAVGGKFVMDRMSQPSAIDEAERQRQFNLLMGITDDSSKGKDPSGSIDKANAIDVDTIAPSVGIANGDAVAPAPSLPEPVAPVPIPETDAPKKRGLGIKSIFTKKKNERETNLNVLMSQGAIAPEVAMVLSKLLTYGAPGRFPLVNALAGGMPLETFELEKAKEILEAAVEKAGISKEEGAEVFANVVNCMLIDIIDLASSSLGKEASVTYDAVNIVINFMNHAASLYDVVAEGVEITPVTYGGNLPKSKLEQLYGAYAFSAMMKMEDDMNDRIELLRNVFSISEKKAEGIIMNASQKQMMEMMKTEEGQKQMEEMMGGMMGGMEGMEGLGAMAGLLSGGAEGAEPNPEQLKEMLTMLKTMKDSGTIPAEELATVREQFRESFGSSIDDILKQADVAGGEMSSSDLELLALMKGILED
jgi:hypothetical protein